MRLRLRDVAHAVRFARAHGALPHDVAVGLEVRREQYTIDAGEPDSYNDGGVPNRTGGVAAIGAQVFPGFRPSNEVDESRGSVAAYADLEGDDKIGCAGTVDAYVRGVA